MQSCRMVFVVCCCQLDRFRCWTVACWLGPRPKRFVPDPRWPRLLAPSSWSLNRVSRWQVTINVGLFEIISQKLGFPKNGGFLPQTIYRWDFPFFHQSIKWGTPMTMESTRWNNWLDQPSRFGAHISTLRRGCSWKSEAANRRASSDLNFSGPAQSSALRRARNWSQGTFLVETCGNRNVWFPVDSSLKRIHLYIFLYIYIHIYIYTYWAKKPSFCRDGWQKGLWQSPDSCRQPRMLYHHIERSCISLTRCQIPSGELT